MSKRAFWENLLLQALHQLALRPEEQVREIPSFCVILDELVLDFEHARKVALDNAPAMSQEQIGILDAIDRTIDSIPRKDYDGEIIEVLHRPIWNQLRNLSVSALKLFGWENVEFDPPRQTAPNAWLPSWPKE